MYLNFQIFSLSKFWVTSTSLLRKKNRIYRGIAILQKCSENRNFDIFVDFKHFLKFVKFDDLLTLYLWMCKMSAFYSFILERIRMSANSIIGVRAFTEFLSCMHMLLKWGKKETTLNFFSI